MNLNSYIDHTLLRPDATKKDIEVLCAQAISNNLYAVCVNSCFVPFAKEKLKDTKVKLATVVGFPLGASDMFTKAYEANEALDNGADEIDMVINIGMLKERNLHPLFEEISIISTIVHEYNCILKVIIETSLLTDEEKVIACQICEKANADFVKTSTGFNGGGATIEDVALMKANLPKSIKIKASGGIKTKATALKMIEAGANRIGTSSSLDII